MGHRPRRLFERPAGDPSPIASATGTMRADVGAPLLRALKALSSSIACCAFLMGAAQAPAAADDAQPNVVPITMGLAPNGHYYNRILVTVTICKAGTASCVAVPDVMIDTGSTGLRLQASALPPAFVSSLTPTKTAAGHGLAECERFQSSNAWGKVYTVDATIGDGAMTAPGLPVQIITQGQSPGRPSNCPSKGVATSNGTLGIGAQASDCLDTCVAVAAAPRYYFCTGGTCQPMTGSVDPRDRLPNPITRIPLAQNINNLTYANGIVIDFPKQTLGRHDSVNGRLIIGVDTQADNRLASSAIVRLRHGGYFTTQYGGFYKADDPTHPGTYENSYFDTGTQQYVFEPGVGPIPACPAGGSTYCPSTAIDPVAMLHGADATDATGNILQAWRGYRTTFEVLSYNAQAEAAEGAMSNIAVAAAPKTDPTQRSFAWGAPFFLGKRVAVLIDGYPAPWTPGLSGPAYGITAY